MHIFLTVALHAEARPLIDHFGLKQDTLVHALPVFHNETMTLIVGGVGKLKAAIATTYLLSHRPTPYESIAINMGIAGSTQAAHTGPIQLGDPFVIHKITDHATCRAWYPDMLFKMNIDEAAITTVDKPLARVEAHTVDEGLIDMEAAGFFQAAATFLPPHHIACIKIVSDFLEIERFDKAWISGLIGQRTGILEQIIERCISLHHLKFDVLDADDQTTLENIRLCLRLTVTQHRDLTDWARTYKLRTASSLPDLTSFTQLNVSNKQEGRQHLERLRTTLLEQ